MAKRTRAALHTRRKVRLNSISGIIDEQGRIFRAYLNGKIKSGEMTQAMYGLREIRQSIEALPPEPVADTAPPIVNVVSVPSSYYVTSQVQPNGESRLMIEHEINPAPPIEAKTASFISPRN